VYRALCGKTCGGKTAEAEFGAPSEGFARAHVTYYELGGFPEMLGEHTKLIISNTLANVAAWTARRMIPMSTDSIVSTQPSSQGSPSSEMTLVSLPSTLPRAASPGDAPAGPRSAHIFALASAMRFCSTPSCCSISFRATFGDFFFFGGTKPSCPTARFSMISSLPPGMAMARTSR